MTGLTPPEHEHTCNPPQSRRRASIPILRELFGLSAGVVGKRLGFPKTVRPAEATDPLVINVRLERNHCQ